MSLARLVITAVVVEQRSKSEVAREYVVPRMWVQKLVHRYQREARPRSSPVPGDRTAIRGRSASSWRTRSCGSGRR